MTRIALISDTHGYFDDQLHQLISECDEVWHAGDIGHYKVLNTLQKYPFFRGVYGNIDDSIVRRQLPENLTFTLEGVKVFMTHIGGYPGRYNPRVRKVLDEVQPDLYICGHSHILKVMPDKSRSLIHMNPGACGHHGFHVMRTILRFSLEKGKIKDVEAIELGKRGKLTTS